MIKVAVFAGGQLADFSTGFDVYVGVDRGSLFLIENQLPLDLAVGDFDFPGNVEVIENNNNEPKELV